MNETTTPQPIACFGMTVVGSWLGVGRAAVSKWCKEYDNTPTPATTIDGRPGWLLSSKPEWIQWYTTAGPGRPSHEKRKHLRLIENTSDRPVAGKAHDRLRTPEEVAADPFGNGDFVAVVEKLAHTMAQTDRSNAARRAAATQRNKESAK